MRKLLVVAAFAALLIPAEAGASILLGVEGSKSRFRDWTNQATDVNLDFIYWGVHKTTYLDKTLENAKPIPMLSFGSPQPGLHGARATGCSSTWPRLSTALAASPTSGPSRR